jgi:hypothetical protein
MSKAIKVTVSQLAEILYAKKFQKGAAVFAYWAIFTEPRMNKTGNPYLGAKKLSEFSILLNTDYEKGVTNQLAREGKEATDYKKGRNTMPLTFGENNTFIGDFEGNPVVQYRPYDNSHPKVKYFFEGQEIDKSKLEPFMPPKSPARNQGTEKQIFWQKTYLSNVVEISIDKETYQLID